MNKISTKEFIIFVTIFFWQNALAIGPIMSKQLSISGSLPGLSKNEKEIKLDNIICTIFKRRHEITLQFEDSNKFDSNIEIECNNEIKLKLNLIQVRRLKEYLNGTVKTSELSDGRYLLSSDKFRIQFKLIRIENSNDICELEIFDILKNEFIKSSKCTFLKDDK